MLTWWHDHDVGNLRRENERLAQRVAQLERELEEVEELRRQLKVVEKARVLLQTLEGHP
jgi:cell shape-determining protein MreC